ncbi:uncharacterized protein J3D65DRAFT_261712 [Phyllosticta citribraziliensis]|uniref:Uncharacterized protein n=1 Tax=Phyllosticta citribraziliensis TaxID=989973 RepID=A0ABR1M2F7_9PEZI
MMPYNHPVARSLFAPSSQSSDGADKQIPSFRDFVKTAPPPNSPPQHPSPIQTGQPDFRLPETSSPGSASTPNPHSRTSGESSWTRPSTWDYDDAQFKTESELQSPGGFILQPETYVPPSRDRADTDRGNGPGKLFLEPRAFDPLLPDTSPLPSPEPSNRHPFEYETIVEFSPRPASESPPRAPLPPVPLNVPDKVRETSLLGKFPTPPSPSPSANTKEAQPVTPSSVYGTPDRHGQSISNHGLQTPDSTPRGRKVTRDGSPGDRGLAHQFSIRITSPKKLVPRSAAPGADDEWEDFEETTRRVTQDRISHDYHKALAEQYRELAAPTPDVFEDDDEPAPLDCQPISPDDANMAPQPLRLQKSPVESPRDIETISLARALNEFEGADQEPEPKPRSPSPPRRRASMREKLPALATGTLQMILPSQHNRKASETSATSGDIPISAPAETTSFSVNETAPVKGGPSNPARYNRQRPRSRVYPATKRYSGMYSSRPRSIIQPAETKKSKKSKKSKKDKENDKSKPYTPPLPLTLPTTLSTESSPRPSAESRRRLPPVSPVPGTPRSATGRPSTPSAFATVKSTTLAQRRLGPQGPNALQRSGLNPQQPLARPPAPLPLKSHFSHSSSSSAASPPPFLSPGPTTGSSASKSPRLTPSAGNAPHAPSPLQHGLTHTQLFAPGLALTTSEPSPTPSPPLTAPATVARTPSPSVGYPRPMTRDEPSKSATAVHTSSSLKPRLMTKSKSAAAALSLRPHRDRGPPPPPPPPPHDYNPQPRMFSPSSSALPAFSPRSAPLPPLHSASSSSSAATTSASLPVTPISAVPDDTPRRSLVGPGLSLMRKAVEMQRERKRGKAREELKRRIKVVGVDGGSGVQSISAGGTERSAAGLGKGRVEVLQGEEGRAREWV